MIRKFLESRTWISLGFLLALSAAAFGAGEVLQASAGAIAKGLGQVTQTRDGRAGTVYLFEENHVSKAGQIEIATMLVRLYNTKQLRTVGLEGFTGDKLVAPWATTMRPRDRLRVAARLLGDGELSSAEFLSAAYPDVVVAGIDDEKDYKVEVSGKAGAASTFYLLLIAERSMSEKSKSRLQDLLQKDQQEEALEFAIKSDPWTKRKYEEGRSVATSLSTEATLGNLSAIEAEANKRGVEIPPELAENMRSLKGFYLAAERRSDVMAVRLARLAKPGAPVAGIVGAAHTSKVVSALAQQGVAVTVIRPNALSVVSMRIDQGEYDGYGRKLKGLSVDKSGLGAILQKQRKPPPVISQSWLRTKAGIYQTTAEVVGRVLVSLDKPPYNFANLPAGYVVDPKKLSRVGDEVVFAIEFDGDNGRETIWVRAAYGNSVADKDKSRANIDERINNLLAEAGDRGDGNGKEPPKPPKTGGPDTEPPGKSGQGSKGRTPTEGSRQVAPGIYAHFSKDRAVVEKQAALAVAES